MSISNSKRAHEFLTNFTIPRKQLKIKDSNNASDVQYHPLSNIYEDQNNHIYKTVSEIHKTVVRKEVPKTGTSSEQKYKDSYPHLADPSLPAELTSQFQPLFCKLCECQHSSNIMAKLHYNSKKHLKKVRIYLVEYSERTGTPINDKVNEEKQEDNNPKHFYCEPCDLPLTGRLHAESHYSSRNHRRVILGAGPPAGKGQYDSLGNWIRIPKVVSTDVDNFGLDFAIPDELKMERSQRKDGLRCYICNVCVTSEQQMNIHVNGTKHKKKVKQQEEANKGEVANPEDSILSSLSCTSIPKTDLSVFRTPSGFYYCNPCNLTLNSVVQFKQHLDSKKHKKKANNVTE